MQHVNGTRIAADALLFDMDGTLVDSTAVIAGLWRRWSAHHGVDPEAVLLASPGRRAIETVRLFAPPGVDALTEAAWLTAEAAQQTEGLIAVPGVKLLLESLPPDRWGVVTSAERALAERWLRYTGLPVPEVLVTAEDVSVGKPDPAGYLLAAKRLGCSPSAAVVFEDAPAGLAAGQAAGARVIALATTLNAEDLAAHHWIPDFLSVSFTSAGAGMLTISSSARN